MVPSKVGLILFSVLFATLVLSWFFSSVCLPLLLLLHLLLLLLLLIVLLFVPLLVVVVLLPVPVGSVITSAFYTSNAGCKRGGVTGPSSTVFILDRTKKGARTNILIISKYCCTE